MRTTYPHIRVSGDAHDRGVQYGAQARDRVHGSLAGYERTFRHYTGWEWPRVREHARRFEAPIVERYPAYAEEIRGIAAGAGVDFEDILALNVRTEVMFSAKARKAADERGAKLPRECSALAVLPEASAEGHTLIGQNWDWLVHCFDTVVVLEVRQPDAPDFVTVVEAGLLAKAGMSSAGIALCTNALVTDVDHGRPGIPYHVLLRAIFDAETPSDALASLQRAERSSSANYLLAHEDGVALDVEAAPGDFSRLFLDYENDGVLLHTNHFVAPRFDGRDVSVWAMPDSPFRLARLRQRVADHAGPLDVAFWQEALCDHATHPLGVCAHPDARAHPLEQSATVAALIMDPAARRMWVAGGSPCTAGWEELDCTALLGKPSAVRAGAAA
jgi:isopenicillin-N N-acyltransferase-like protein